MIAKLTGQIQPYAWGSLDFIPELLGTEPTGEPQAELWLGAHPSAPSDVEGTPLDRRVAEDPAGVVGQVSVARFGPRLTYLMKVLAADQPLSLQAHPSRAQAERGFAREEAAGIAANAPNRVYRDDWPKPEVLCALQPTEALCGFRDPDRTYAMLTALGVPGLLELAAPLADEQTPADQRLAAVFERLLLLEDPALVDSVVAAAEQIDDDGDELGVLARTARELGKHYPGDPGVLAALLMNRVSIQPGDALYLPAGNLHAYLSGGGIELMANSDNVMRGGLTPKHIDVPELLSVLDFHPGLFSRVAVTEEAPGLCRYQTPAPEFTLWRLTVADSEVALPASGAGRIGIVTEGEIVLRGEDRELTLRRGESAFITPADGVVASGTGTVFLGGPGVG